MSNVSNFSIPPPFPPINNCVCPTTSADVSCVSWNATNHIEVAVVAGVVFGAVSIALIQLIKDYCKKKPDVLPRISRFSLDSIPEVQEIEIK